MNLDRLEQIANRLLDAEKPLKSVDATKTLASVGDAAERVARAWSGSWLGYHSRVYYNNLQEPPPGAHFSKEWGISDSVGYGRMGTIGDWTEFRREDVINEIWRRAGNPDISELRSSSDRAEIVFDEAKADLQSFLSPIRADYPEDKFVTDLANKIDGMRIFGERDFLEHFSPKGQQMSRDMNAIQAGIHVPPHYTVKADIACVRHPFIVCGELAKLATRLAAHLANVAKKTSRHDRLGNNIFIGHGKSKLWKDLKDFIQDRLHLPWDEFNRVPIAGVTNIARLSEMLDEAAFAFLIMTAEDEQSDGKLHARMNVVHEAGLFQGRLGFQRAIILLEEGCEEFSNVQGLGQIRFPKGDLSKTYEEIRQVLEREEILLEK